MADGIQNIINSTLGDGARSAKFRCFIDTPLNNGNKAAELDVLCKASSFPGKTTETMDFKHKGKSILVPGQEKFSQTWELTFYLEESHNTRIMFDNWMSGMHYDNYSDLSNQVIESTKKTNGLVGTMAVSQLNFEMDSTVCNYVLHNVYPVEMSQVEVASDSVSTMLEYTVTFAYTHYDVYEGEATLNANDIAELIRSTAQGFANDAIGAATKQLKDTEFIKSVDSRLGELNEYITDSGSKVTTSIKNFLG